MQTETDSDGTAMSGCNMSDRDGSAASIQRDRRDIGNEPPIRKLTFEDPRPDAQGQASQQQQDPRHFDVS